MLPHKEYEYAHVLAHPTNFEPSVRDLDSVRVHRYHQ